MHFVEKMENNKLLSALFSCIWLCFNTIYLNYYCVIKFFKALNCVASMLVIANC